MLVAPVTLLVMLVLGLPCGDTACADVRRTLLTCGHGFFYTIRRSEEALPRLCVREWPAVRSCVSRTMARCGERLLHTLPIRQIVENVDQLCQPHITPRLQQLQSSGNMCRVVQRAMAQCGRYIERQHDRVSATSAHSDNGYAHTANGSAHSGNVSAHSANVSAHSDNVSAHSGNVSAHTANGSAHSSNVAAHWELHRGPHTIGRAAAAAHATDILCPAYRQYVVCVYRQSLHPGATHQLFPAGANLNPECTWGTGDHALPVRNGDNASWNSRGDHASRGSGGNNALRVVAHALRLRLTQTLLATHYGILTATCSTPQEVLRQYLRGEATADGTVALDTGSPQATARPNVNTVDNSPVSAASAVSLPNAITSSYTHAGGLLTICLPLIGIAYTFFLYLW